MLQMPQRERKESGIYKTGETVTEKKLGAMKTTNDSDLDAFVKKTTDKMHDL